MKPPQMELEDIFKNFDFFPQIQTVFVGVFECVCVFEQIVFVYLYIKIKYNFFQTPRCNNKPTK